MCKSSVSCVSEGPDIFPFEANSVRKKPRKIKYMRWNEDQLIQYIQKQTGPRPKPPFVGIGDDGALIHLPKNQSLITTTDSLVEDVHFLRKRIRAEDLGWKTLAVNLSDLAAMGATPKWVLLNLSLPPNLESGWVENFLKGFFQLAQKYKVQLMGGDTTASKKGIFISVTAMGVLKVKDAKLRTQAKANDLLCVTGPLGSSRAGLALQSAWKAHKPFHKSLLQSHHRPEPRVNEGVWLAQQKGVHAMMDVSDGLLKDSRRLAKASGVGVYINAGALPITQSFVKYCAVTKKSMIEEALLGGEDYELLFTANVKALPTLQKKYAQKFKKEFSVIGSVGTSKPKVVVIHNAEVLNLKKLKPFEHF